MKILYAIQGTGNGHLSRAKDVIPAIAARAEVDILISGIQADIKLPFEVKYQYKGMSFIFGKQGGVDLWQTFKKNKAKRIYDEIKSCPVEKYDLVINDFEPISAWACFFKGVKCISLSHQCALISPNVPRPTFSDWIGSTILKFYAPTKEKYGFHFKKYDDNIFTPVIRQDIRNLEVCNGGHYTVYLPAYSDKKIIKVLSKLKNVTWHVFSKHSDKAFQSENVFIQPINGEAFGKSMAEAEGVLCGAGFETPAEALFLGKKLMVIPMKSQYEQHYNAQALKEMGVPVLKKLKKKHVHLIKNWVSKSKPINTYFPDQTQFIVDKVIENHITSSQSVLSHEYEPQLFID